MPADSPSSSRIIRCFIYARMSSDREGSGLGIERQVEDCHTLAATLTNASTEYRVVRTFQDNDMSAYSGKPRKDYLAMLDALRASEGDAVLAWHTDRLHRSPAELEEYIDVCEPRRVETRTVKAGHLDLTTATGRMIARQLGVQARYEVERMVERQRRRRDQMAQKGEWFGGRRPFGWEADGMTLVPDEAAAIREAADAVLAGASLRSIVANWNERGILTSTGAAWQHTELRRMLMRPRNAGIVQHRGREAGPAQWPAILDEPLWRSVCAILSDPSRRTTPGNDRKYMGSNLYLCGVCGQGVRASTSGTSSSGHVPAYRCKTLKHITRSCDPLDDYITLLIIDKVSHPDAAALLARRDEPQVDVAGAQRDMREARATLDELAAALGAGEMDMQEWRVATKAARARLQVAEDLLGRAVQANPVVALVSAKDPDAVWQGMDLSRRRAVVAYLMAVTIHPARKGRLPGGVYFDTEAIDITWR